MPFTYTPSMIGETLGHYRITEFLSRGGMGAVYVAEDLKLGRKVAIKVLLPHLARHSIIVKRFSNEARGTAAIKHPGIVEVLDYIDDRENGVAALVMELLDGQSLKEILSDLGHLPVPEAIDVIGQVLQALAAAHAERIIHRDLKPANIMAIADDTQRFGRRLKVLDFGVAKIVDDLGDKSQLTKTGIVMGTPTYMAPEQISGKKIDHRADLYATGCIFFELVCGRPPFIGNVGELIGKHQYETPPAPHTARASIPMSVESFILRMLAKRPDARPTSARAAAAELSRLLDHVPEEISSDKTEKMMGPVAIHFAGSPITTLGGAVTERLPPPPAVKKLPVTPIVISLAILCATSITVLVQQDGSESKALPPPIAMTAVFDASLPVEPADAGPGETRDRDAALEDTRELAPGDGGPALVGDEETQVVEKAPELDGEDMEFEPDLMTPEDMERELDADRKERRAKPRRQSKRRQRAMREKGGDDGDLFNTRQ